MQAIETAAKPFVQQENNFAFGQLIPIVNTLNDPTIELCEVVWENPAPVDDGLFDRLVEDQKLLSDETVARFHCPDLEDPSMLWGSPEYFRWYTADGIKRDRPFDFDELVELICFRDHCSTEEAEREVALHSRAKSGDKETWKLVELLGYADFTADFARAEYGVL